MTAPTNSEKPGASSDPGPGVGAFEDGIRGREAIKARGTLEAPSHEPAQSRDLRIPSFRSLCRLRERSALLLSGRQ